MTNTNWERYTEQITETIKAQKGKWYYVAEFDLEEMTADQVDKSFYEESQVLKKEDIIKMAEDEDELLFFLRNSCEIGFIESEVK